MLPRVTAPAVPTLVVKARPAYNEADHPRDSHGKWIRKGTEVRDLAGNIGKVVGKPTTSGVTVELPDGSTRQYRHTDLTVTRTASGRAVPAPKAPAGGAPSPATAAVPNTAVAPRTAPAHAPHIHPKTPDEARTTIETHAASLEHADPATAAALRAVAADPNLVLSPDGAFVARQAGGTWHIHESSTGVDLTPAGATLTTEQERDAAFDALARSGIDWHAGATGAWTRPEDRAAAEQAALSAFAHSDATPDAAAAPATAGAATAAVARHRAPAAGQTPAASGPSVWQQFGQWLLALARHLRGGDKVRTQGDGTANDPVRVPPTPPDPNTPAPPGSVWRTIQTVDTGSDGQLTLHFDDGTSTGHTGADPAHLHPIDGTTPVIGAPAGGAPQPPAQPAQPPAAGDASTAVRRLHEEAAAARARQSAAPPPPPAPPPPAAPVNPYTALSDQALLDRIQAIRHETLGPLNVTDVTARRAQGERIRLEAEARARGLETTDQQMRRAQADRNTPAGGTPPLMPGDPTPSPHAPAPAQPPAPDLAAMNAAQTALARLQAPAPDLTAETVPDLTDAQKIAIKQKWKLPTGSVADLQAQLAQVKITPAPTVVDLIDKGMTPDEAAKEHLRLAKNAKVNAWRARTKLQAAIDTAISKDGQAKPPGIDKAVEAAHVGTGEVTDPAVVLDALLEAGDPPQILYDAAPGSTGPGSVGTDHQWYDRLTQLDGKDPIPVAGLTVGQYKIGHGWAQRINGRSYMVESKPGESPQDAAIRLAQVANTTDKALAFIPEDKRVYQRGVAVLNGANPADGHWAQAYGVDGFVSKATGGMGGTNWWNGNMPDPATTVHEFGHNLDSQVAGNTTWLSQSNVPVVDGQPMAWQDAADGDWLSSGYYLGGRFVETHQGEHPIILGQPAVTQYGKSDEKEAFAEALRLYAKDQREGKLGYDPTTGDNLRFQDLFPQQASVIRSVLGLPPAPDTLVQAKRKAEAYDTAYAAMATSLSAAPKGLPSHQFGLTGAQWTEVKQQAWAKALDDHKAKSAAEALAKEQAKQAAEQAAKDTAAKAQADAATAAAQVDSIQKALDAGLISKAEADKFRARKRAAKYHAKQKGKSEAEAQQIAQAYETALIQKHLGALSSGPAAGAGPAVSAPVVPTQPWLGKTLDPTFNEALRAKAAEFLGTAGKTQHPLAAGGLNTAQQAKANIAAELASRMNNPADWEVFRAYKNKVSSSFDYSASTDDLGPFDAHTPEKRQALLAKEASARVAMWASSSGDTNPPAVLMQEAVKQEFGITGKSAPSYSPADFQQLMDQQWGTAGPLYRLVARHMYEHTQEEFKKAGITHVSVYRGMSFNSTKPQWAEDGQQRPELQPVNSWSTNKSTSLGFGQVLFSATIPVELVVGSAVTGFGCLNEWEIVIMDAAGKATVKYGG